MRNRARTYAPKSRAAVLFMLAIAWPAPGDAQVQAQGVTRTSSEAAAATPITVQQLQRACSNVTGASDEATRLRRFCDLAAPAAENVEAWQTTEVPSAESIRHWAAVGTPVASMDSLVARIQRALSDSAGITPLSQVFDKSGAGFPLGIAQPQTHAIVEATKFITAQAGNIISHYATTRFGHQLCDVKIADLTGSQSTEGKATIQLQGGRRDAAATTSGAPAPKDGKSDPKVRKAQGIYLHELAPSSCRLMLGEPDRETGRYANTAAITLPSISALRSALRRDLAVMPDGLMDHYTRRGAELYRDALREAKPAPIAERVVLLTAAAQMARAYQAERDPFAALKAAEAALLSITDVTTADVATHGRLPLVRDVTIALGTLNAFRSEVLDLADNDRETAILLVMKLLLVNAQQYTGTNQHGFFAALAQRFPNRARTGEAAERLPWFDAGPLWTHTGPAVTALLRAHDQSSKAAQAGGKTQLERAKAYAAALPELVPLLTYIVEPVGDGYDAERARQMTELGARIPTAVLEERYTDAVVDATALASMIGGQAFENAVLPRAAARTLHFAADIVYAKEPSDVEAAIKRVAAPVDAYTRKRDNSISGRRGYVTINAYVGGAAGIEQTRDAGDWQHTATSGGLWVPLGIEVGLTRGVVPAGLFLQLVDLGQVAAWRFAASDDTVKADPPPFTAGHIFSPGVFIIGHLRQAPISFGFGGSYAPRFRELGRMSDDGATEPVRADALRLSFLVGVDVPILPR